MKSYLFHWSLKHVSENEKKNENPIKFKIKKIKTCTFSYHTHYKNYFFIIFGFKS